MRRAKCESDNREGRKFCSACGSSCATRSLARLLANQNRSDETRRMLAEIYNWFTEGFDTPELKDARALLDELSA